MRVRWRLTKARHTAISFEVVEWSEQLRSVTSAWLGAVRRSVQIRLCTSEYKSEKIFGVNLDRQANNPDSPFTRIHSIRGEYCAIFTCLRGE